MNFTELPEKWEWSTLGKVAGIILGQSPPRETYNVDGLGLPFFQGKAEFGDLFPSVRKWCTSPKKIAEPGDILVSVRAPVGPTNLNRETSCIGRGLAAIRPLVGMPAKFILFWIRNSEAEIASQGTGSTFSSISGEKLRAHRIPLPPLAEQHRIVAAIEEHLTRLDAAVAGLERAQANLKRYRASVLAAACSGRLVPTEAELARREGRDYEPADQLLERILDERRRRWESDQLAKMHAKGKPPKSDAWKGKYKEPVGPSLSSVSRTIPCGWIRASIDQLASVATGATPLRSNEEYYDHGVIPWVTSGALNSLFVDSADEAITPLALEETNAKLFPPGTLLVAMYGEGKTRGKVSELRIEAATNQACAALLFDNQAKLVQPFIKLVLLSHYDSLRRLAVGANQPNLSLGIIRSTFIELPPLAEQRRIVTEIERQFSLIDELERSIEHSLARAEKLRQSILRRAFEGKLVPQDPSDEPASVLLERIRTEREANAPKKTRKRRSKTAKAQRVLFETGDLEEGT